MTGEQGLVLLDCSGKAIPKHFVKTIFEIIVNSHAVASNTTLYFNIKVMKLRLISEAV